MEELIVIAVPYRTIVDNIQNNEFLHILKESLTVFIIPLLSSTGGLRCRLENV